MEGDTSENLLELIKNVNSIPGVKDCSKTKMYLHQWLITVNFFLVIMMIGTAHGHSAILLEQLKNSNSTRSIKLDSGEIFNRPEIVIDSVDFQSWIASIMVFFMCPGCWILALCSKKVGRKTILLSADFLFFVSWIVTMFANNAVHLMIGRSLSGLCMGIFAGLTSVYQGECSIPKYRSLFNAVTSISFSMGVLTCHAVGIWFHWRTTALFCSLISLTALIMNSRMPESPIWLLNRNKLHEAIHSWTFLRGIRDLDELSSMQKVKKVYLCDEEEGEKKQKVQKFCTPQFLKPLGIIIVLFTLAQMSGMGAVTFYCIQMISEISGPENAYIPTLILDTVRLMFSIVLTVLAKRYSPRILLLCSAFNCALFLILLSIFIVFQIGSSWFALALLFFYEATIVMGVGPLPWIFCSELFSVSCKETGIGIVTSYNYMLFFIIVKINPYLFVLLQPWGTFLFYGIFTSIATVVLYFILPNTHRKSLKEIELMFCNE